MNFNNQKIYITFAKATIISHEVTFLLSDGLN